MRRMKRSHITKDPQNVKVSLQDLTDLNWALYIARMQETIDYCAAKVAGNNADCEARLDELKCIAHADRIVNSMFDQIISPEDNDDENR